MTLSVRRLPAGQRRLQIRVPHDQQPPRLASTITVRCDTTGHERSGRVDMIEERRRFYAPDGQYASRTLFVCVVGVVLLPEPEVPRP